MSALANNTNQLHHVENYMKDLNRELDWKTRKLAQITKELQEEKRLREEEKRLRIEAERKLQLYILMNKDDNICIEAAEVTEA